MYYFIIQWKWIPFWGGLLVLVALNLNLSRTVVGQSSSVQNTIHHHDAAVAIENSLGSHHYSTISVDNNANEDAPLCQETTVVNCVGISAVNATCLYRHLYIRLANQSVVAYTIRGSPSNAWFQNNGQNSVLIHLEGLHNDTYPIQVHSFESQHALNEYCTSMTSTTSWRHIREPDDGLYAVFTTHHYQNIGHAILDGLWPLMLGMRQVLFDKKQGSSSKSALDHDSFRDLLFHVVPLQFFTNQRKTGRQGSTQSMTREKIMATDAFQAIAGKEGRVYDHLLDIMNHNDNTNHHHDDTILVLPRAVVGAGHWGQRAMTADYKLFQGEQYLRSFRDRVYQSLGITPINITRQRQQEQRSPSNQKQQHIHVRIFDNKRYSPREKRLMHQLIEEYNNQSNSTTSNSNITFHMHFVQWSEYPTFAQQIQLIAQTHVYISGPGTGLMLSTFLPDGAVVINLGQYPVAYMEEYLAAAAFPHIHALYYNRCQQHHLQYDPLRALIQQAVDLVVSASSAHGSSTNTHTTIDNETTTTDHNRSPVGKAFVEFMQRMAHDYHPLPREAVYDVLGWDVHASLWAEEWMFEKPGLLEDAARAYGWNVSHVRDVLQAVRQKHGIANCFANGSSLWPTKEHVRNSFAYRFFPDEDDG